MFDQMYKLTGLINEDAFFWFFALTGSGMFLIQGVLSLFGAMEQDSLVEDANSLDAGKFKWLSKQAVTGFLMMFGWVGLTCHKQFGLQWQATIAIAFAGGLTTSLIAACIFKMARQLHSSGTVFNIEDAVGKKAVIYQRIPSGGTGKVSVSLHHLTYELNAISLQQEELPSFSHVQIIKTADDKTVVVVPIGYSSQ
ncbi:MAG: hypothetical protein KGZ39_08240 [Simkania sp.]|nr:hypothetical protein [Simkania sp.]